MKKLQIWLPLVLLALATSCDKSEFTSPAFIHLDAMVLEPNGRYVRFSEEGLLTSDIVAVYVVAHRPGAPAEDTIGLFRLPFTAPILFDGTLDYLEFSPAIQQSGATLGLPYYTFYKRLRRSGVTLHTGDTLNFGTDTTSYDIGSDELKIFVPFEQPYNSIYFDSVMEWVDGRPDEACTGNGYGRVHVSPDRTSQDFALDYDFDVDYSKYPVMYLEFDTRSDVDYEIYMHSRYQTGSAIDKQPVMVVRASEDWNHLYVNMGRTWDYFNHYHEFRISFTAINGDCIDGDVRLDNLRLVVTPKSL